MGLPTYVLNEHITENFDSILSQAGCDFVVVEQFRRDSDAKEHVRDYDCYEIKRNDGHLDCLIAFGRPESNDEDRRKTLLVVFPVPRESMEMFELIERVLLAEGAIRTR